jgi:hypothetical protein
VKSVLSAFAFAIAVSPLAAADFAVTNTNSSGLGSLYQAITDANNTAGADRILFNIPGAGVHKIDVSQNPLPTVLESLVIDGYSQPGAKPNSLGIGHNAVILIQLDGGAGGPTSNGLVFSGASSDYVVRGLCLTGFGEPAALQRGVAITASEVHSAVVAGNFIGVLPDGETPRGNYIGVGHVTLLGGTDPASRNVISGNRTGFAGDTYLTPGTSLYGAVVQGNYIGTNASGTKAIPNVTGIGLEASDDGRSPCTTESFDIDLSNTMIGAAASGAGNLISGNEFGILLGRLDFCGQTSIASVRVHGVRIKGNLIGVQSDGVNALPNEEGIWVISGSDNLIGGLESGAGNVIAFNDYGVGISPFLFVDQKGSERNQILSNVIHRNRIGIDLGFNGPSPNDAGDSDDGPNKYQNYPVIQSAEIANGSVTINGTLNSSANSQFTLQYFAESRNVASAVQTCLGTGTVTTDADGHAQFSATFALSDTNVSFNMTATSHDGNTSEFSHPARLKNISTRVVVQGGDQVAIAGFIVRKTFGPPTFPPVQFLIRALGPSLQSVSAPLLDPALEVYDSTGGLIASNDNWRDDANAYNVEFRGLAPTNDLEAAVWETSLSAENYTAVVRGAHGSSGIALVEVYDFSPTAELLNVSTRGFVGTGDDVMIAGMILEQDAGSNRIVARAIGPSLGAFGVSDPLSDPVLELRDSQGAMIASNDNWHDGQPDALTEVGLAPSRDSESAIFMRLPSGAYTAIVRGKGSSTGVALVEIYNLH